MLAFITPIGVILVIAIANGAFLSFPRSLIPKGVALFWLASLVLLSPLTSTWVVPAFALTAPGQFPPVTFGDLPKYIDYQTFQGIFSFNGILFREYLPKVDAANGEELYDDSPLYRRLHATQYGGASLTKVPCGFGVPKRSPLEALDLTFAVRCKGPTRFALPVSYNRYSSVFFRDPEGKLRQIPYYHVSTDPRIIINVPNSKPQVVVVHLPTLWGILW